MPRDDTFGLDGRSRDPGPPEPLSPGTVQAISPLEQLLVERKPPGWRMVTWPIMIMVAGLIFWSTFATLDEVSIASGEVKPVGDTKVVQHLEGGIVQEIYVQEGDSVTEGQSLMLLDLASGGTNKEELQVRLDSELLIRARLQAEAEGQQLIDFPPDVAARRPTLVQAQEQAFRAKRREAIASVSVLREQVRQRELDVQELIERQKTITRNHALAGERLKLSASLLADGLTARIEHLELEAEVQNLDGEKQSLLQQIPRAKASVTEAKQRVSETLEGLKREAREQLGEVAQNIARTQELLSQAKDQGARADIKSPTVGIIQNMSVNTVGGVVRAGDPIMEIVPTGDKLVIEAKLNPTERGFVFAGQEASVKISTYDFVRYGGLEGRVSQVAPDASTNEDGTPFFRVIVETDKTYLGEREGDLPITPGMQAQVDIKTGKKTVMEYLIKPVLKLKEEAFRER